MRQSVNKCVTNDVRTCTTVAVSAVMLATTNILFIFKYASRASVMLACAAIPIWLLTAAIAAYAVKRPTVRKAVRCTALVGLVMTAALCIFCISKETLNVDRWEIIALFFDSLESGLNPYAQHLSSGNPIGAMPIYFLLLTPFHYLSEVSAALALLVLSAIVISHKRLTSTGSYCLVCICALSVPLYWELACRSTIMANAMIFLPYMACLRNISSCSKPRQAAVMLLGGLLLATRTVFALPMAVAFGHMLASGHTLKTLFGRGCLVVIGYLLPMLPFIALWPDDFMRENPFMVQGTNLIPIWIVLILLGASFLYGCTAHDADSGLAFACGVSLFAAGLSHIVWMAATHTWEEVYMGSAADISYLLFSYPFLVCHIITSWKPGESN